MPPPMTQIPDEHDSASESGPFTSLGHLTLKHDVETGLAVYVGLTSDFSWCERSGGPVQDAGQRLLRIWNWDTISDPVKKSMAFLNFTAPVILADDGSTVHCGRWSCLQPHTTEPEPRIFATATTAEPSLDPVAKATQDQSRRTSIKYTADGESGFVCYDDGEIWAYNVPRPWNPRALASSVLTGVVRCL